MNVQEFWNDKKQSEEVLREVSSIKSRLEPFLQLEKTLVDAGDIIELAREEGDTSLVEDVRRDLEAAAESLEKQEVLTLFSGPDDAGNAILSINSGAGGTESMDWAEMLLRMYTRYTERRGCELRELDVTPGEEAGIKSASLEIKGDYAFGMLKAESGVHRLVRSSPVDAASRRHTSVASVFVYPEIDDKNIKVEIRDDDLQVDTYRASGAGGQHINKTDSAVRITHKPTRTVVQCQSERSQHRNRENAMKILRAKLYALKLEEERAKIDKMMESQKEIAWGSQIRSYVLHPYTMVKDHRTDHQVGDSGRVLDGDLDGFIEAYLHKFTT
jgi:peptide chain release factor 2